MKKILTCLLAAALLLSLAACGSDAQEASATPEPTEEATPTPEPPATPEPTPTPEPAPEPGSATIDFENVVLYEDENVSIELIQFYEEEQQGWGDGDDFVDKCANIKFKNKGEYDFFFILEAYVGEDAVNVILWDGNNGPAPGKSANYKFGFRKNTSPEETPLDSLEDLYNLDGRFEITLKNGNEIVRWYDASFSVPNTLNQNAPADSANEVDTGVIEDALQGTWSISGGCFAFSVGSIEVSSQGGVLTGTYEINSAESRIEATLTAADGNVSIKLPYTYSDGQLELYNNNGEALVKG